jgi:hypothetical protein
MVCKERKGGKGSRKVNVPWAPFSHNKALDTTKPFCMGTPYPSQQPVPYPSWLPLIRFWSRGGS